MTSVRDKGRIVNRINTKVADIIAKTLGRKVNYSLRYFSHRHRFPNFKSPSDLSERILTSMLSDDFLKYAEYADKVRVREYVIKKGLQEILLKQYGSWENAEDIPFDSLPEKFILKANNGSGGHIICTNKSELDIPSTIVAMNATLNDVHKLKYTEPHYAAIPPLIVCEEWLGDGKVLPVDYKFHCINGQVADIFVVCEREEGAKYCTLDVDWNILPYTKPAYLPTHKPIPPQHLKEMIQIAETLSSDFEFVRVDLYDSNGKVYFGELTFSPWGGIMNSYTTEAIKILGEKFK